MACTPFSPAAALMAGMAVATLVCAPTANASGADAAIAALEDEGYIVQINWVNGASKSLPQCTVVNVNNPSSEPPKAGDTVYVDVRCPNHDYDDGGDVSIGVGIG